LLLLAGGLFLVLRPAHAAKQVTPTNITVSASAQAAATPYARQIVPTFVAYFGGINRKNFPLAISAFTPRAQAHEQDLPVGDATSYNSDVVIRSISRNSNGSLEVHVTFTSTQHPGDGPRACPNETSTNWSLDYRMVFSPAVGLRYRFSEAASPASGFSPCP